MDRRRRAVKDEQKQERRQAIIDVAWQLFQGSPYQAITMAEVAERAGLAKGTVYLYFKTKEELFLAVQEQLFQSWFDELDARLGAGQGQSSAVSETICRSLERRGALASLLAILHTVLEQNVDFDAALRFKRMLLDRITRTGALLEGCLTFLRPGQGPGVLLQIYALIIGVEHLSNPAPAIRQVLREPGMQIFDISFRQTFSEALTALLRGLEVKD